MVVTVEATVATTALVSAAATRRRPLVTRAVEVKAAIHYNLALPEETASRFGRSPYRRSHRLDPAAEAAGAVTRPPVPMAAFMVEAVEVPVISLPPVVVSRAESCCCGRRI